MTTEPEATTAAPPPRMPTCFVIGPIGDRFAPAGSPESEIYENSLQVYEHIIEAACRRFEIEPVRADGIAVAGEITEQIFRHVLEDDIVIADVGGGNANVMYELGLRHATGKLTIQIGEYGQLPFDISSIRTIRFSRSDHGLIEARKELERALEAGLLNGYEPPLPAKILLGLSTKSEEPPPEPSAQDEDGPGIMDNIFQAEQELAAIEADTQKIASAIEAITAITDAASADLERVSQPGTPVQTRMAILAKYGESLNGPSEELADAAEQFAERMEAVNAGITGALDLIALVPHDRRDEEAAEFLEMLIELSESAREHMEALNLFSAVAKGMGGMSRQLRGPGKNMVSAIRHVAKAVAVMHEWEQAARALQERRTGPVSSV